MNIYTERQKQYEEEIAKYCVQEEKWKKIDKWYSNLTTFSFFCCIGCYTFLLFNIGLKIFKRHTPWVYYIAIILFFVALAVQITAEIIKKKGMSLTARAKIWRAYQEGLEKGELKDIKVWHESDKIFCHLVFGKEGYTIRLRLDEFDVKYEDVESVQIILDDYIIILPEKNHFYIPPE